MVYLQEDGGDVPGEDNLGDAVVVAERQEVGIKGFFIGRNSRKFSKFPFYPQGPIKFDIGQIFPFFSCFHTDNPNSAVRQSHTIMFYSCFYL